MTWIEPSFFDPEMVGRVHGMLAPGGAFIFDDRNPEHPRTRQRGGNWRTWREEEGAFYLERHETDPGTGLRESAWITIDPVRQVIEEKTSAAPRPLALSQKVEVLRECGFTGVELRTMEGNLFPGGPEPYWLWVVGRACPQVVRDRQPW